VLPNEAIGFASGAGTAMGLIVQKFGGTSVATPERIHVAAARAIAAKKAGNKVVVVVSAMGDTTDDLIELARKVCEKPAKNARWISCLPPASR